MTPEESLPSDASAMARVAAHIRGKLSSRAACIPPRRRVGARLPRWLFAAFISVATAPAFAACPPEGHTRESLQGLKLLKFTVPEPGEKLALAEGLLDCLGDPDPALRDGIAYEAMMQWLRAGDFDADALRALRDKLQAQLAGDDAEGLRRPFAALVMSELARTDRIAPWMTPVERVAMVEDAATYLESVRDYRGFDDKEGWRHGVAHGSDWLLQLALNPALERAQADRVLAAIAAQTVPEAGHAYVFGEPGRLARPLLAIAQRGVYSDEEWQAWFAGLPPKLGDAAQAYNDAIWLGRRHDLMAFLMSLYLEADQASDEKVKRLKPAIVAALKQVP